ncbi:hypothetical protein UlMin_038766 [Ulmus minor]
MLKSTWKVTCSSHKPLSAGLLHREAFPATQILQKSLKLPKHQMGFPSLKLKSNTKTEKIVCNSIEPGSSSSAGGSWKSWILGVVISLILPFWRHKWGPLLAIKNQVDTIADTIEAVAEVIEDVAEKVEDIADDIGDNLENGKLKDLANLVEDVARETAKDAHMVDQFIEKVEEVEDKVESFIEPVIKQGQAEKKVTKQIANDPNA